MASYETQQEQLRRRRAIAQALSGAQTREGQMVGRQYVAPSPWEQLATVGQKLTGALMERNANRDETALKDTRRKQLADMLSGITGAQAPTPTDSGIPQGTSPAGMTPPSGTMPGSSPAPMPGAQPAADPQRSSMLEFLKGLPIDQQEALVGQQAMAKLFPAAKDGFTLKPGERRYDSSGKLITEGAPDAQATPAEIQGYNLAKSQGFPGSFVDYQTALKKAGATNVSTNVNTEKNLYGTMADAQGKANTELYAQAQKAPELLTRARRVKELVGPNSQAITGAGAEWLLAGAKIANQLGFNTGDAAADTEALSRDLAASTLDQIKSSGLGAGSGFSNADRDFLERVVGGKITLESTTLARLADLNEKSALATIGKWNATASRLDPAQLQTLGMSPIEMPAGTPPPGKQPKLVRNADGSYTYSQ